MAALVFFWALQLAVWAQIFALLALLLQRGGEINTSQLNAPALKTAAEMYFKAPGKFQSTKLQDQVGENCPTILLKEFHSIAWDKK